MERESVAERSNSSGFSAVARHNALAFRRAGRERKGFGWAVRARLARRKAEAASRAEAFGFGFAVERWKW